MLSWSQLANGWNWFFFCPESVATLCLCRVLLGLLLVADGCLYWPWRQIIFGPQGVLSAAAFNKIYGKSRFTVFNLLPESPRSVDVVLGLYILSGLCVAVGLATPVSLIAAWVLAVSLQLRGVCFLNAGDGLLRILLFLFCFSPAGTGLSVDAWLAGRGVFESLSSPMSPWCLRLLQIQVAMVYFRTFAWKMRGSAWLNGTAVLYAIKNTTYRAWPVPGWLLNRPFVMLATYGTLVMEWSLGTLIWVRELRHPLIVMGLLLHLGIEYALNLQLFGYLMVVCLLLFVDANWVIGQLSVVSGPLSGPLTAGPSSAVQSVAETVAGYWLVNGFIIVYLFYAYIWNAPNDTALKPLIGLIRPVVRYFGLWHTWAMFAPNPFLASKWIELEVQFHDGGHLIWKPDYEPTMTRWQKFCRERFRKIGENCHKGEFEYVRWCLCEYVIRQYRQESDGERAIKQVLIHHVEEPIVDFQTKPDADLSIKRHLHYTYVVK